MMIGSNVVALRAQNALNSATRSMQKAMRNLSTGKRINSAADDPAGFAMATNMNSQITGMTQAVRNAKDGLSLAQTAEGALDAVTAMAQRMRELAVGAASGSYTPTDRAAMQAEVEQIKKQMTETLQRARFNGIALFDTAAAGTGSGTPGTPGFGNAVRLQVGSGSGDTLDLVTDNIDMSWTASASITTPADANTMMTTMDDFLKTLTGAQAGLGAQQNGLEATIAGLTANITNMSEAVGRIMDADYAAESMALAKSQLLAQSSTAMLAQANQMQKLVLDLIR